MKAQSTRPSPLDSLIRPSLSILLVGFIFSVMLVVIAFGSSFGDATFAQKINALFGMDTTQLWWYVTRAAGLTGHAPGADPGRPADLACDPAGADTGHSQTLPSVHTHAVPVVQERPAPSPRRRTSWPKPVS